jgi:4-aminobutyrate aminotransferase-like enzyme
MDVVRAGFHQMATQSTNLRYLHDAMMDYAEQLISTFPGDKLRRVFFVNSGTEANELALWLARVHTKQQDVISLRGLNGIFGCHSLSTRCMLFV